MCGPTPDYTPAAAKLDSNIVGDGGRENKSRRTQPHCGATDTRQPVTNTTDDEFLAILLTRVAPITSLTSDLC